MTSSRTLQSIFEFRPRAGIGSVIVATIAIIVSLPILACTLLAIRRAAVPESGLRYSKFLGLCEFCARVFLGLMFLSGGLSKLMPFPGVMGPVWLEESLIPYGLGFYARFIAWSEATIGLMLLTRLTAVLGFDYVSAASCQHPDGDNFNELARNTMDNHDLLMHESLSVGVFLRSLEVNYLQCHG
jgi:hypothetical protein